MPELSWSTDDEGADAEQAECCGYKRLFRRLCPEVSSYCLLARSSSAQLRLRSSVADIFSFDPVLQSGVDINWTSLYRMPLSPLIHIKFWT
jgi:hypothetical protein